MSEIASGAVQGAMAGASLGPVGIVAGALFGAFSGSKARKARKAANKAQAERRKMEDVQNTAMRRQQFREYYIGRAESVAAGASDAGGLESSPVLGAVGGLGSQFAYNTRYFDTQMNFQTQYENYMRRSQKQGAQSQLIMQGAQLLGALGGAYMRGAGKDPWQSFSMRNLKEVTPTVKYTPSTSENFGSGMKTGLGSRKTAPTLGDPGGMY